MRLFLFQVHINSHGIVFSVILLFLTVLITVSTMFVFVWSKMLTLRLHQAEVSIGEGGAVEFEAEINATNDFGTTYQSLTQSHTVNGPSISAVRKYWCIDKYLTLLTFTVRCNIDCGLFSVVFHTFRRLEVGQESRIHLPHILRRVSCIRCYDWIQRLWLCKSTDVYWIKIFRKIEGNEKIEAQSSPTTTW